MEKLLPKIFLVGMVGMFGLVGIALIRAALKEILKVRRRRPFLITVEGTILTVNRIREQRMKDSNSRSDTGIVLKFLPVVAFTTSEGKHVQFRSEHGESHHLRRSFDGSVTEPQPKWTDGQKVEVYYDPESQIPPGIVGLGGASSVGWAMFAGGSAFLLTSIGLFFLFFKKVMAA